MAFSNENSANSSELKGCFDTRDWWWTQFVTNWSQPRFVENREMTEDFLEN
jgi:hypothetical protein